MNPTEIEIYRAIRPVRNGPTLIRYLCLICESYLSDWDVQARKAVCWRCRKSYFPTRKVEAKDPEPKKSTLFQLRDGKFAIVVE